MYVRLVHLALRNCAMATDQSIILDNNDGSTLDSKINIPLNTDNLDTEVKSAKRKRGRPPKSTNSGKANNLENKEDNYQPRKKRNVTTQVHNYNDLLGEDSSGGDESDSLYCKIETKPKKVSKVKKRRGRPSKNATPDVSSCVKQEETEIIEIQSQKPLKLEDVVLKEVEPEATPSEDAIETGSNKPSKYKKTGQKAVIVKHLFRGLQGKSASNEEVNTDPGQSKRKKGRPKAKPDCSSEDGETTCMICHETIQMRDWWTHKLKLHNNLAWKQGDLPMDLQDRAIVQKTLTQVRKEQGYLECHKCETEFTVVKKFIDHFEICNGIEDSNGFVRCAICKTQIVKSDWTYHRYRQHNNLAWRVGDTPLNLEDQDTVMHILSALYKLRKPLYCEICNEQKKSVLGYLSHKSACQLGGASLDVLKVACEVCGRKVLPVSLDFHMKTHNKPKEELTSVESQVGDRPRKAATQALQVIKGITGELGSSNKYYSAQCDFEENFVVTVLQKIQSEHPELSCIFTDCTFKSIKVENMVSHLKSCDKKPAQYFICKVCLAWTKSEEEMAQHVKADHRKVGEKDGDFEGPQSDKDESGEDDIYYESEAHKKRITSKTKTQMINKDFTRVIPLFLLHPIEEDYSKLVYKHAYPWTLSFCEKYHAKTSLFDTFRNATPWPLLDCDILDHYLPKNQQSCDVTFVSLEQPSSLNKSQTFEFTSLDLFEVRRHDNDGATVFCGGPITSLAWLPTSYTEQKNDQILAVAVLNDWDTEYSIRQTYNERSVVQFWNFGCLSSNQENDFEPYLLYGLALNSGPVWSLEWCPSGCVDTSNTVTPKRLGLLAIATSDSFVYIYSVDTVGDDTGFIYKGEPVVKLKLSSDFSSNECYATRISWTKAAGHRYIAVGYTNGVIALFDLVSTSALLRQTDSDGVQTIFPYNCFQGHFTQIIGLTLSHLDGGNRFCCSSSHDKMITYWDLFNNSKIFSWRLNSVVDSLWPTHWPMCITGEDETTFTEILSARTYLTTLRHSLTSTQKTTCTSSPSGINSVGFSDWLNLVLHSGNTGEVMGMFAHRLFANMEQKRFKKKYTKCIFSTTHLIKKNQSDEDKTNQFTFQQISKHYGLALVDYNSDNIDNIPNSTNKKFTDISNTLETLNISNYPLQAVIKVVPNPNQQAYSFYATGLQAGLIRIRKMRFLDKTFQPFLSFMDQSFTEHL